ncbi:uncharacterized protein LOC128227634 isoform X1 [Mya arenaria]|uniref:uncharacterized protein LOC128227634 isoform X1 n=1 Tax=Mya arenaria TaxID=6604 RepID=UPI0022E29851|nr:uncharacterized protein LOC128227634 isoform X1 [Mya arenaria]
MRKYLTRHTLRLVLSLNNDTLENKIEQLAEELKAMKGQFQGHDERNSRCPCNDRIVLLETYPAAYKTRGEKDPTELDILDVECGLENQNGFEVHHVKQTNSENSNIEKLMLELSQLKTVLKCLMEQNDTYKQEIKELKTHVEQEGLKKRTRTEMQERKIEQSERRQPFHISDGIFQKKLQDANLELLDLKQELEDTKTRLSKLMGEKLTDKNPNIADLSDKNRPTKLAERYSELYDSQWTDAFDCLNNWHDEATTIKHLSDILKNAMRFCSLEAQNQMKTLQKQLMFSASVPDCKMPRTIIKSLQDCRKSLGEQTGRAVFQKYVESLQNGAPTCMELKVLPYLQECIQLSWLMCIQDPPVVLSPDVTHGANFDTDFYKAYTKSGPLVDYVVWPALCLHEKGPLLCKGIAQGSGGKKEV